MEHPLKSYCWDRWNWVMGKGLKGQELKSALDKEYDDALNEEYAGEAVLRKAESGQLERGNYNSLDPDDLQLMRRNPWTIEDLFFPDRF